MNKWIVSIQELLDMNNANIWTSLVSTKKILK